MIRAYAGATDLQRMEQLLATAYASTLLRVGDISWLSREHTHRELSLDIQLVEDSAGQLIGWAYFRPNGEFNVFVTPDVADADDGSLLNTLLDFVEQAWRTSVAAGDPAVTLNTYCIDPTRSALDRSLAAILSQRGFTLDDSGSSATLVGSLDQLPEPSLPAGYHFDWVRTTALRVGRVEAHRAAFANSDLSVKKYERVQRTWAYRRELDRLVVTEAGFATYSSLGFTRSGPDLIFSKNWRALQ